MMKSESEIVAHKVAEFFGAKPPIDGADYVVSIVQIGGYKPATATDFEIPQKYGLRQTIAHTPGIGGIRRALRTVTEKLCYAYSVSYTHLATQTIATSVETSSL